MGITELHIWDNDKVCAHNLGNQIFKDKHIGCKKTDAIEEILKEINPEMRIIKHDLCTKDSNVSGIIFLCIDNIDVRRELVTKWKRNPNIQFIIDGRMGLHTGSMYAADWSTLESKNKLINTMQYSHEEALAETPVSACGLSLSIVYVPRTLAAYMVANMVKFLNTDTYYFFLTFNGSDPFVDAYTQQ